MEIRKLTGWQEKVRADHVIATSFLLPWHQEETEAKRQDESASGEELWAAFEKDGTMTAAVSTLRHTVIFDGRAYPCGELHMVGSLPEARNGGIIRQMIGRILQDSRERGDLFSLLIPFSFPFYRKYGYELASENLLQKAEISQFSSFSCQYRVRQLASEGEVLLMRGLHQKCAYRYNLADLRSDADWRYRGGGEYGERDWMHKDKTHYTYLFWNGDGQLAAYLTFVFVPGPEGPFTGEMDITDIAFDCPQALRDLFGFIYTMRAKITGISVELPKEIDLSVMLPESDAVERRLEGHIMARPLDVERTIRAMRHSKGTGSYSIRVEDAFLPENTGVYQIH